MNGQSVNRLKKTVSSRRKRSLAGLLFFTACSHYAFRLCSYAAFALYFKKKVLYPIDRKNGEETGCLFEKQRAQKEEWNQNEKKIICLILGITLLGALLTGCGREDTAPVPPQTEEETPSGAEVTEAAGEMPSGESIQTNGGETISLASLEHQDETSDTVVYYTSDISPEAMVAAYDALGTELTGESIAVKLSTGEPPASNYLDPDLIADLVHQVNGTIVENNTAYGGQRSSTAMHYQVAEDHGFTDIADFVVLDEDGSVSLPVEGGAQLSENLVGAHFPEYDGYLVLSHFKGHAMAGFGGAIKNISIGMASQEGKCLIHTAGESHTSPWGGEQDPFTESMAEAGKSVVEALDGNILYISVMNHLSVDCDCDGNPAEPDMHDIGILASADPVALDQACVDLVYASQDDTESLINRMESRNAVHVLEHGEDIGLGSRTYQMVSIDE